ncbi:MAG: hypothetical protein ACFFBS_06390 [Promethearchaeota archaeon]
MVSCHDMKKGDIYYCGECGLELQVVKECREVGKSVAECECSEHGEFSCCGLALKKR